MPLVTPADAEIGKKPRPRIHEVNVRTAELEIAAGDKVAFTNLSNVKHQVHPYGMESKEVDGHLTLAAGGSRAIYRFKKPGTYTYRCDVDFHSDEVGGECIGMCGTITVSKPQMSHHVRGTL